jgi:predicted MFS family arabinose efflux permease
MQQSVVATCPGTGSSVWRAALAGLSALLVGIGLARFAYTPLIPAVIDAGWFPPSQAVYLGAANLAGYLAGALLARRMTVSQPAATVLRSMMLLATAAFFACAFPLSFAWYFGWRFAAGLAGGVLMVLAAPTVLPHIPPARRGLVGGVIFTGVGIGIIASGTLVPFLLRAGVVQAWCGLGVLALLLTAIAWRGWPNEQAGAITAPAAAAPASKLHSPLVLKALYVGYALSAVGMVPHMVFLVDFVARGLGQGLESGARYWVLFGLGALVGPVLAGHLADRIGFGRALRLAYLVEAVCVAALAFTASAFWLAASSLVIGAFTPGITTLVLGRTRELIPQHDQGQRAAWSRATVGFSLGQAAAAYGFSFLFARTGNYACLFALGGAAVALALAVNLVAGGFAARLNQHLRRARTRRN